MKRKKALLIVDVQNDFCAGGALAVPKGNEVIPHLNRMISYAVANNWLVILSLDWHPPDDFGGWPPHCAKGTKGAEFHPDLIVNSNFIIIYKNGYSVFGGFTDKGQTLEEVLKLDSIEEVYGGGLATNYCVKASFIDAAKKGFKTFLLIDACRAVDLSPGDEEKAIEEMRSAGVVITTTREVLNDD